MLKGNNSKTLEKAYFSDKPDHKRLLMDKIHKMDSGRPTPPVGYHRWHAFIRATTLLNEGPFDRWLQLDRHVAPLG